MHGLGNDFVVVDAWSFPGVFARTDLAGLAKAVCDRHLAVGADGMLLVGPPDDPASADLLMRVINADGSEAEMCGNGLRCVARLAHDRLGLSANPLRIRTARGIAAVDYTFVDGAFLATVDMGAPSFDLGSIPVDTGKLSWVSTNTRHGLDIADRHWHATFVSLGNPHAVLFADDHGPLSREALRTLDVGLLGRVVEHHPAFPQRINAHFAAVESPERVLVRTWERGAGQTLACGSGACAVVAAGVAEHRLERDVRVHVPGGELRIRWDHATDRMLMTGPAEESFRGDWPEP